MRLDVRAFALAGSVVAAVAYLLCAVLIMTAGDLAWAWFGALFHIDFQPVTRELSWVGIAWGLVSWVLGVYLFGWTTAWLYNRIARP